MLQPYNLALTQLHAELDWQVPRPVEVMAFMRAVERFGDPSNMSWQELQRLNAVPIIGDAISHLRGWPMGMAGDVHERVRLLDVYRGDHMTNGLLQMVLTRFPRRTRNRHLDDYGNLVCGANWNDSDVESFDSDKISYHGDSDHEAHHNME